jgi:DNA replication licensing factor MCM3
VQESDTKQAEDIMKFALFKEVPKRKRRKKRKLNTGGAVGGKGEDGSGEESDGEETSDEHEIPERMSLPPASPARVKAVQDKQPSQDPIWGDESQDLQMDVDDHPAEAGECVISPARRVYAINLFYNELRLFVGRFLLTVGFGTGCSYSAIDCLISLRLACKTKR